MKTTKPVKRRTAPAPQPRDEIEQFVDGHQRLLKALDAAEQRATDAEKELQKARHELAAAQARALVEDPTADPELEAETESNAFVSANLKSEAAKAAVEGCRRALAKSDIGILGHVEQLKARRQEFNEGAVKQFIRSVFRPAAKAFAAVLKQGAALEAALGEEIEDLHQLPTIDNWRDDEKAVALFDGNSKLKSLADSLEEFRLGAEQRTLVIERDRVRRAAFDPSPDAKFAVMRTFQCYGKTFAVGEVVSASDIDLALRGKLYSAKFLRLIDPEMEGWTDK